MNVHFKNFWVGLLTVCCTLSLAAQEKPAQKEVNVDEMAIKEAERLADVLKLEDWQVFYADSILRHDYGALHEEVKELQLKNFTQQEIYQRVQDKWMEKADNALQKVFTAAQWKKYLKDGAGKRIREREKRKKERDERKN